MKMSVNGQVTIPKAIRDALRLEAGDTIQFTLLASGTVKLSAKRRLSVARARDGTQFVTQ